MDYNKLKTFLIIADYGSITAAAQHLFRSQSAISQQILALEEELNVKLLERRSGKIFLSKDGETIYKNALDHFNSIDQIVAAISEAQNAIKGHIKIGELTNYGNQFSAAPLISKFVKIHPDVTFEIIKGTSEQLENMLLKNEIDLAFTVYFNKKDLFNCLPIEKTWHSLYVSEKYQSNNTMISKLSHLLNESLIDLTQDFICISTFLKKNQKNLDPMLKRQKPAIIVDDFKTAAEFVAAGSGIAILPDYLANSHPKKRAFKKLFSNCKPVFAGLDLAIRKHRTPALRESEFINYIKNKTKNISKT